MTRIANRRAALFTAVSSLSLCIIGTASAQDATQAIGARDQAPGVPAPVAAPATDGSPSDEITITGFGASLKSALNAKRLSNLPIELISPEDVGKLPDQNVAESLQRLPGIQIDRTGGRGTAVLIDGLRQNLTTLNGDIFLTGKEFYVSGEAAGGGSGG